MRLPYQRGIISPALPLKAAIIYRRGVLRDCMEMRAGEAARRWHFTKTSYLAISK